MTESTTTAALADRSDRRSLERFVLTAFPCGHFAVDWPGSAIYVLAPAMALTFGLSPAQVGLLITVHAAGASLAFLPAGLLADSVRRRGRLLAVTFWWASIGFLWASLAGSYWALVSLLALGGFGASAWHPIATGVMVEQMPNRKARVLGIHAIGGTLAGVGAPLCAGFLLAVMDWRSVLQVSVIPTVLMGFVFLRRGGEIPERVGAGVSLADLRSMLAAWFRPTGLRIIAIVVFYNMAMMATLSMLPLFMQDVHGFDASRTGMLFACIWMLAAAAQPVLGGLSDRVGRKRVAAVGMLVGAVLLALFSTLADSLWVGIVVVAGAGTLGGIRAVLLASMVEMAGQRESTTLGFSFSVMDGVGALGALFGGLLGTHDFRYAFFFAASAAFCAMVLTLAHTFGNQITTRD